MNQLLQSADELEKLRQEYMADAKDGTAAEWDDASKPGSFGCHELLDRTALMMGNVDEYIVLHPACLNNREWFALALQARDALNELYRQVGEKHL